MLEFIKQEKLRVEEILRNDIAHKDKEVVYILYKQDTHETKILACNPASDEALEFPAYTEDHFLGYANIPYWDYNYDQYIYELLEYGWKIGYMTPEIHYSIWNSINELYPESIDYKNGVQNYLQYCIENGITKEFLDKTTNLDTPDIMKYFNYQNNKTNYEDKTLNEKPYLNFILGYDLLQDMFKNSNSPECDTNYDFCDYLSSKFMETDEYKYANASSYDVLKQWIDENKIDIQYEYNEFIGMKYETYNNMTILEKGNRNGQPIALVKRAVGEEIEYIIAFNYEIKNNSLTWGYGYYYSNNIKKAHQDYEKVIGGGNLANTFRNKKEAEQDR